MSAISIGPIAMPVGRALLLIALGVALIVGRLSARRRDVPIVDKLIVLALVAIVAARVTFVLRYWGHYVSSPLSIIDIRDGGFESFGGLIAMAVYASVVAYRWPAMRRPLAISLLAGGLVWGGASGGLHLLQPNQMTRPDMPLVRLDGGATTLDELAAEAPGAPMVVNFWASWCPPCRAEMPMLTAAQKARSGVSFVFVNQGEPRDKIRNFLKTEAISPHNMLIDDDQELARAANVQAFPTTLFFAADGHLVDRHMGLLSRATLARALNRIDNTTTQNQRNTKERS
ncbi:TlpA family protein disulfide reductase [Salinisphaera sp. USBA-960]|uniref:prolipoprotein diacylglyceryl transferase family protein n=1 Tax=Salinisphaera orenii TaxID=856731 RepID=UPI000DBE4D36|nr:TlpA family protein disulfide reductase [Salifodinibacter halophilus]NNC26036.1 TlpA family protein disulfide reductase [Salifodinibacter halophilus]